MFGHVCEVINRNFRHKTRRHTGFKVYKTIIGPVLLYGSSESCVLSKRQERYVQAEEARFFRAVKGCTKEDRIRNADIRFQLQMCNVQDKLEEHRERMTTMDSKRIPPQGIVITLLRKEEEVGDQGRCGYRNR